MFKFLIYKFGQFLVNHLSLEACYRVGIFFSDLQYLFSFRDRQAVRDNLRVIMPKENNLAPHVREVFRNFGRYLVEFFRMVRELDKNFIRDRVRIFNIERLKQAKANGKGIILLTAHIGNWELGGVILSLLGYPYVAIALPHKERPVNELFNDQRELRGVTIVSINNAMRKCLETLRNNGIVAMVADRDFTANGEILDFLGKETLIPKGAAIFAAKTGAAILPIFLIRQNDNTFNLFFEEPIYAPQEVAAEVVDKDILLGIMKRYVAVIEEKIKEYPTQWLMFRRFWVQTATPIN